MRRLLILPLVLLCSLSAWASWGTPTVQSFVSCSASPCSVTPTAATGVGDLQFLIAYPTNNVTITAVTGRASGNSPSGNWYHPTGGGLVSSNTCAQFATGAGIDCAYNYSSTGGSGAIQVTFSGAPGSTIPIIYVDEPYTNGPINQGESPQALSQSSGTSITGAAFHPVGTDNFCVQGIDAAQNVSSINSATSGYSTATISGHAALSYLANTLNGTAPIWTISPTGVAAVDGICFVENAGLLTLANTSGAPNNNLNAQWGMKNAMDSVEATACMSPNNVAVVNGYLQITTLLQTASCADIDFAYTSYSYTSAVIYARNVSFLYGSSGGIGNTLYCGTTCDIVYRAKLASTASGSATNSGAATTGFMFDATCVNSYPTGTDNNCVTVKEIDIAQVGTTFTTVQNLLLTTAGGSQSCTTTTGISDTSQNYHNYELVWGAASLVYKVDGTTTCTITTNVPSTAMMMMFNVFVGGPVGGTVNNSTLPWTTTIDYWKVTNSSGVVIFNDDFTNVIP